MSRETYYHRHLHQYYLRLLDTEPFTKLHHPSGYTVQSQARQVHVQDTFRAYRYPGVEFYPSSHQSRGDVPMNHPHPAALVPGKRQTSVSVVSAVPQQTADPGVHAPVFEVKSESSPFVHVYEQSACTDRAASLKSESSERVSESYKSHTTAHPRTESKDPSIVDEFSYLEPYITTSSVPCSARPIESGEDGFAYLSGYIVTGDTRPSSTAVASSLRAPTAPLSPAHFTPSASPSSTTPTVVSTASIAPPPLPPKPLAYMYPHQYQYQYQCHSSPASVSTASASTASSVCIPPPAQKHRPRAWPCAIDYEAWVEDKYSGLEGDDEEVMVGRGRREDGIEDGVLRVWSAYVPGWTF